MLLTSVEPFIGSRFTAVWLTRFGSRDYRYLLCPQSFLLKTIHSEGFQDDPISRRVFWGEGVPASPMYCACLRPDASRRLEDALHVLRLPWHFHVSDTNS